jgi:hypothetical protein
MLGVELLLAAALQRTLVVRVDAVPRRSASAACGFLIVAPVRGGGRETTCLTDVVGYPGPNAVIHSRGRLTIALARGSIRARVSIVQRFGSDGVHARQTLRGTVVGGTRAYRGARGTISGGGTVVDRRTRLGRVRLAYRLLLR